MAMGVTSWIPQDTGLSICAPGRTAPRIALETMTSRPRSIDVPAETTSFSRRPTPHTDEAIKMPPIDEALKPPQPGIEKAMRRRG